VLCCPATSGDVSDAAGYSAPPPKAQSKGVTKRANVGLTNARKKQAAAGSTEADEPVKVTALGSLGSLGQPKPLMGEFRQHPVLASEELWMTAAIMHRVWCHHAGPPSGCSTGLQHGAQMTRARVMQMPCWVWCAEGGLSLSAGWMCLLAKLFTNGSQASSHASD